MLSLPSDVLAILLPIGILIAALLLFGSGLAWALYRDGHNERKYGDRSPKDNEEPPPEATLRVIPSRTKQSSKSVRNDDHNTLSEQRLAIYV